MAKLAVDLRAVAELTGVSISTVSRALNGSSRVSATTRGKVARAAESLNYRPNVAARGLRTRQSKLVGVVLPNLVSVTFVDLFSHLQAGFRAHGYEIVLSVTNADQQQELAAFDTLRGHQVDGIIAVGSYPLSTKYLRESAVPSVHLFTAPQEPAGDCVTINAFESTRDAVTHCIEAGHRRIGCIDGYDEETRGGYKFALSQAGIPFDESLIYMDAYDTTTGTTGIDQLLGLADPPTAVFFGSYETWLSGIPRILDHELRIPEDISVVCRDDAPMLRWWRPAITVVDIEVPRVAELAVGRLVESMANGPVAPGSSRGGRYQVSSRLIERESVVKPH
jgi:LacI family transcriptional regulator